MSQSTQNPEKEKLNIPLADWAKLTGIATLQDIADLKEELGDTSEDINSHPTKEEVTQQIEEAVTGLASEDFVSTKVAELVDSAPETLDTLRELAEALQANEENDQNSAAAITEMVGANTKLVNDLSTVVDTNKEETDTKIEELSTKIDNLEIPSIDGFATTAYVDEQLATKAEEVHQHVLADVTDYVAPDLSSYATKDEVSSSIAEVEKKIPVLPSDHVTQDELNTRLEDMVEYIDYGTATPDRKSIQLKNHDTISGLTVEGSNVNLVMLSKWNKADFGSAKVTMNLNTVDNVTINDSKVVATVDQIPDVSNFAASSYVDTKVQEVSDKVDAIPVDTFAVKDQVAQDISFAVSQVSLDSLGYVEPTAESLGAATAKSVEDLSTVVDSKVDASYVDTKITELIDGAPETLDTLKELSDALNDNKDGITALVEQIGAVDSKVNNITTESLGAAEKVHTHVLADITDYVEPDLSDVVRYIPYGDATPNRQSIQLKNHDTVSGLTTTGSNVNLVMLSKWDKADFGSAQVECNLNAKDGTVTINDSKVVATVDQIPDVSAFITEEALVPFAKTSDLPDFTTFAKTTEVESDMEDLDVRLTNAITTAKNELKAVDDTKAEKVHSHTLADITDYKAPDLSSYATKDEVTDSINVAKEEVVDLIPTVPEKLPNPNTLTVKYNGVESVVYDGSEAKESNLVVNLDTVPVSASDSTTAKQYVDDTFATKDELPHIVQIPIRSLKDQVYTKDTILKWFDVKDDIELKKYISGQIPMVLKYGISYSALPHYYKFPIEYIAYESATQVKLVLTGLNTRDDSVVKYTIIINLNEALIDGTNSNVSMVLDPVMQDLSSYATLENVDTKISEIEIPDISPLATKSEVTLAISSAQTKLESDIAQVEEKIPDVSDNVKFTDFTYNEETRKTIQLDNYDSISSVTTSGLGVNLAMVSKWDVADFGSPQVHANINTSDAVTVNDNLVVVTTPVNADDPTSTVFDLETAISNGVASVSGDIEQVISRLNAVEDQVSALKKTNVVPVVVDGESNLNQPEADLVLTAGEEAITAPASVVAKSIDVKSMNVESSLVSFKAANGDVNISNYGSTGDLPKATSNAQVKIQSSEYVKITASTFAQTGYNAIEIGLDNTVTPPKNIIIDGLDFSAKLSNNAILIFGHQEDAVVTISNCHFADISNAIRISNRLNVRGTFNFINCTCDKWDSNPTWAGFVICQDYTSGSKEAEETNNLFAPDKIMINFINCYGPNGKITAEDPSDVCGTNNKDTQVLYVWNSYGETVAYDVSRYPTVTFK